MRTTHHIGSIALPLRLLALLWASFLLSGCAHRLGIEVANASSRSGVLRLVDNKGQVIYESRVDSHHIQIGRLKHTAYGRRSPLYIAMRGGGRIVFEADGAVLHSASFDDLDVNSIYGRERVYHYLEDRVKLVVTDEEVIWLYYKPQDPNGLNKWP